MPAFTTTQMIDRATTLHNNLYEYYSNIPYINNRAKVKIYCKLHGDFSISWGAHINGKQGCRLCGIASNRLDLPKVVEQLKVIHCNRYEYKIPENYINSIKSKLGIKCSVHGWFSQQINDHRRGRGCKRCTNMGFSNKAIAWLNHTMKIHGIHIQHALNGGEYKIPEIANGYVDGYCEDTRTVYEFYGDVFHGNPQLFAANDMCHPFTNITAGDLYQAVTRKQQRILDAGYKLVEMWEHDFDAMQLPVEMHCAGNITRKAHIIPSLVEYGVELENDVVFMGFKAKHKFKCMRCKSTYSTTATALKQRLKKYKQIGCASCSKLGNS